VARAEELSKSQQEGITKIKSELATLDKQIRPLVSLLVDPDIDSSAKKTVSRQIGELEQRREQLNGAMGLVAEVATETTERLGRAVRQALDEARALLSSVSSPAEFNRFVARFVGPIVVGGDGSIQQKTPVGMLSHPTGDIAGGGFEPPTSGL